MWSAMLVARLNETVALSCDLNPDQLKNADRRRPKEFKKRLGIAINHAEDKALPLVNEVGMKVRLTPLKGSLFHADSQ
jgi:hypothetical protein